MNNQQKIIISSKINQEEEEDNQPKTLEDKQEEWLAEYAFDITAQSFLPQDDDEWGSKCLNICGNSDEACYIEFNKDKYRYNWPIKKRIQYITTLYIIGLDDGCSYITEYQPESALFDNDDVVWYDYADIEDDDE